MTAAPTLGEVVILSRGEAGRALGDALAPLGFRVRHHQSAGDALGHATGERTLLAIDTTGKGHDGIDWIRVVRSRGYSGDLIALVEREDSMGAVLALELGADVILELPVHPRVAGAYARRMLAPRGANTANLRVGALEMHLASRNVRVHGRALRLTESEYELLACLAQRAGEALTREELRERTAQPGNLGGRAIDSRVCRLRSRLAKAGGPTVVTLRNRGYLLADVPTLSDAR